MQLVARAHTILLFYPHATAASSFHTHLALLMITRSHSAGSRPSSMARLKVTPPVMSRTGGYVCKVCLNSVVVSILHASTVDVSTVCVSTVYVGTVYASQCMLVQ